MTEVALKPDHSALLKYKLINLGDPTIIKIKLLPFEAKDSLGNIALKKSWDNSIQFELDNTQIILDEPYFLKNEQTIDIFLKLIVPEDTPAKDYYFTLLAESQPPPVQEGVANVRSRISLGSNILITVAKNGQIEINPKISLFEVIPQYKFNFFGQKINLFSQANQIPVILIVDNKGKNLIKPRGEIILKGPFWQTANFEIKPQNVLAESQRTLTVESKKSSNLQPQTPNGLTLSGFYLGKYNLSANISFGEGTPTLYSSTSFFLLPIKLIILLAVTLILGIILSRRLAKNKP